MIDTILRIILAIAEGHTEELKKATPEQVQAIVDRRERRLDFWEAKLQALHD
jgi:hypothetical protein